MYLELSILLPNWIENYQNRLLTVTYIINWKFCVAFINLNRNIEYVYVRQKQQNLGFEAILQPWGQSSVRLFSLLVS